MRLWRHILHWFRIHSWIYYVRLDWKPHRYCGVCLKEQVWHVMGDFDRTSFWKDVK